MISIVSRPRLTTFILISAIVLSAFQNCGIGLSAQPSGSNGGFDGTPGELPYDKVSFIHRGGTCAGAPLEVDARLYINKNLTTVTLSRLDCAEIVPAIHLNADEFEYVDYEKNLLKQTLANRLFEREDRPPEPE